MNTDRIFHLLVICFIFLMGERLIADEMKEMGEEEKISQKKPEKQVGKSRTNREQIKNN